MTDIEKIFKDFEHDVILAKLTNIKIVHVPLNTAEEILDILRKYKPKKHESRKKLPCTCGRKALETWCGYKDGKYWETIICPKCGKKAKGESGIAAIREWNRMIIESRECNEG